MKERYVLLDKRALAFTFVALFFLFTSGVYFSRCSPELTVPKLSMGKQNERQAVGQAELDKAIHEAIKEQGKSYYPGEFLAEGHIVLAMAEQNQTITVYSVASVGFFGFENGVFTKISGSGNIPTVITLVKDGQDNYSLLQYKEPMDGEGYRDSIHQMFPKNLSRDLFAGKIDTSDLVRQQENQAGAYLKTIGRKDPVQIRHVEKQFPTINVNASNKLFTDYCKNDTFLNKCPYWIGTREVLEDGARYIYETSQSKRTDGDDQIAFRKMQTTDHTIVKEKVYRIVGNEPVLESER